MNKTHDETMTKESPALALLVPATPEDKEGEATFGMELGRRLVRRFTPIDGAKIREKLRGETRMHFEALTALRTALKSKDVWVATKTAKIARERFEELYRYREKSHKFQPAASDPERQKRGEYLASYIGLSPEESLKHWEGLRAGPRAMTDMHRLFSYEVSEAMGSFHTQLVVWWKDGQDLPAIYCDDLKSALYVYTFFKSPSGVRTWQTCPQCAFDFFQDWPTQKYHEGCGDAFRHWRKRHASKP